MEVTVFYNPFMEMTFHYFCYVLFIRNRPLGPAHTQGQRIHEGLPTGGGDHWGYLGSLPTPPPQGLQCVPGLRTTAPEHGRQKALPYLNSVETLREAGVMKGISRFYLGTVW